MKIHKVYWTLANEMGIGSFKVTLLTHLYELLLMDETVL